MKLRKIAGVVCTAVLLGSVPVAVSTAAERQIVDEGFIPAGTQGVLGRQGVVMMERPDDIETASVLRGRPKMGSGGWKSCSSLTDSNCQNVEQIMFGAILQPCLTSTSLDCVVGFGVVGADGSKIAATVERSFPSEAYNKYPADAAAGLPVGAPGALWSVPASAGLTESLHYLRASVNGEVDKGKAVFTGFAASLTPVSMTTMQCRQNTGNYRTAEEECTSGDFETTRDEPGYSGFIEGSGWDQDLDCEMAGNTNFAAATAECALRKPASLDTKYYLEVRLSQSPQGWLHGRLADADVTIAPVAGVKGAVTISMIGKPVRVPILYKEVPFGDLPSSLQDKYQARGEWPGGLGGAANWGLADSDSNSPTGRNRLSKPPPYGAPGIEELEAWMGFLNDTSTADRVTWSMRTLRNWEREQANNCIADTTRVTGLVLTNATQYLAGAPTYNKATKSLDYKVAAPHYMSNGEEFKGTYQMIVRSDVAKCIYGFSSSAVQAKVDVVESEDGQASAAVTNVSESNGWLRLSATGYTHSSPTIRATFTEKAAARVKAKRSLSSAKLAKAAKIATKKSSKVTLKVAKASSKVCRVQAGSLRALKKGACRVTVSVKTGKKTTKKTILVSVV